MKICKKCGSDKFNSHYACIECGKERSKIWRINNLERAKQGIKKHYLLNRDLIIKSATEFNKKNQEKINLRTRVRRANDGGKHNKETKKWRSENKEKVCELAAKRRANKIKQTPIWANHNSIAMIYRAAEIIRLTGFDVHVDHIIPLQGKTVRGLHVHYNLQIISAKENMSKSNKVINND